MKYRRCEQENRAAAKFCDDCGTPLQRFNNTAQVTFKCCLGLALSRKFIELHGGKIWVKSQVGEFTFILPVRRGE